jgi:1-acyl-sn-glycerol-3-phosphate acyltransferase
MNRAAENTVSRYRVTVRFLLYSISIIEFWAGALLCNLVALLFLPWRNHSGVRYRARIWLRRLMRLARTSMSAIRALEFDLKETEFLSDLRATVVVANHPSLMDAVFLLGLIPNSICIIKKSLQRNLGLGPMSRLCGFITNDSGPDLVRDAVSALSEGCNIIIFPEGTRSQGRLNRFKPGFALISLRGQYPVQAVHLSIKPALLPKGASLKDLPRRRPLIRIFPGRRFAPTSGLRTEDLMGEVERYFQDRT